MFKGKIFEMPMCSGCRTCEMACSFKHRGEFNPSVSAIEVLDKGDGGGFLISLTKESDEGNLECVGCSECVRYCPVAGDLGKIIEKLGRKDGLR